jgi:hypothetical protein
MDLPNGKQMDQPNGKQMDQPNGKQMDQPNGKQMDQPNERNFCFGLPSLKVSKSSPACPSDMGSIMNADEYTVLMV